MQKFLGQHFVPELLGRREIVSLQIGAKTNELIKNLHTRGFLPICTCTGVLRNITYDRSIQNTDRSRETAFSTQSASYSWVQVLYPVPNVWSAFYIPQSYVLYPVRDVKSAFYIPQSMLYTQSVVSMQSIFYTNREPTILDRVNRNKRCVFRRYAGRRAFLTKKLRRLFCVRKRLKSPEL